MHACMCSHDARRRQKFLDGMSQSAICEEGDDTDGKPVFDPEEVTVAGQLQSAGIQKPSEDADSWTITLFERTQRQASWFLPKEGRKNQEEKETEATNRLTKQPTNQKKTANGVGSQAGGNDPSAAASERGNRSHISRQSMRMKTTTTTTPSTTTGGGMEVRAWEKLHPLGDAYSPRTGHTVACYDGRVYVFGGTDRRRRQQDLFQFDIATSSWSQVQTRGALPPRRSGALGVVHDDKMFIFGGYDGRDGNYFNDLYFFNFASLRWDEMPSSVTERPEARTDHIMVLHSSSIYIFGGYNGSSRFNDLWEYSLEKRKWSQVDAAGQVPSRRFGHSAVVHEGKNRLIVFGGWDGRDTLNDLFEYNFDTKEWKRLTTIGTPPPHRYRHTAVIYGDSMFVFGGVDKTHSRFNDLQRLDLTTNTWSEVCTTGSIPSSRTFHRAVVVSSKMYLLGGYDGTDRLQDLYAVDVGPLSPPSLLDICADYVRHNVDSILETTTFAGVSYDVLNHVIFKRDAEGSLRGTCKVCRTGRCCVYRVRQSENRQDASREVRSKTDCSQTKQFVCVCGHSNLHHEIIDEQSLYGKKAPDTTSSKVLMLCGSIYKRLFETTSALSTLSSPRRLCEATREAERS